MKTYLKLMLSLAIVSGLSAGILDYTYNLTSKQILLQEKEAKIHALNNIFFLNVIDNKLNLIPKEINDQVTALYLPDNLNEPVYYAATGKAIGYNGSFPVEILVGFTNPKLPAKTYLKGYATEKRLSYINSNGLYIVGFTVIKSEETPGLGEKIKDTRAPYTVAELITGKTNNNTNNNNSKIAANKDKSTDFQRQFRGYQAKYLKLRKNGGEIDAITAATVTTNAVIEAMKNANDNLLKVIK